MNHGRHEEYATENTKKHGKKNERFVSKLRFPEFRGKGEWDETCILDISSMKARIGWQNLRQDEHLENGEYFLVTGTDFIFERIDWLHAKFVSYDRYMQDQNIILKEGDILITKDGSIGKLAYIEDLKDKKATLNNGIFRIRVNIGNSKFIFYTFLSTRFKSFLQKLSGGSSITHLYQKDFEKYQIAYPSKKQEQQKIADCLTSLDELITAEAGKLEAYKAHKKGLMQKLFPAEGETVPEWRFPEFRGKGEWETKTLSSLAKRRTERNNKDNIKRVLTNSAVNGVVDQRDFFEKDIANQSNLDNYYIVDIGDYVYNPRISVTAPVGPISKNKVAEGVMSPLYTVFRFDKYKNDFFEQYFKTNCWHKYLFDISNTGARHDRMSVSPNAFMEMPLTYPEVSEQQKIADCLSSLDNLITAQTQKIDTLKTHKKGLMQGLFPVC